MDGNDILANDVVFDIVFGAGVVEAVRDAENVFAVRFGEKMFSYRSNGVGNFPQRTLYWRDPIAGLVPNKNDGKWAYFCKLRNAIAQVVWGSNDNAN